MSALRIVKGIVKDFKSDTYTYTATYGSGDHAQTSTTSTEYVDLWLDVDGRDVPIRAFSNMPFLPGHHATFVLRDDVVIFLRNDTADRSHFIGRLLVPREGFFLNASGLLFFAGMFALIPVAGGAPIGHIAAAMLLSPFVAWAWSARARRRVKRQVSALV